MASSHQSLIGTCARENSCVFDGDGQHLPQHSGSFFVSVADKAFSFVTQHFSILKFTFNRVLLDLDLCYLHGDDFVNLYRNLVFSKQNLKGRFWLHSSPATWNISLSVASLLRVPESCSKFLSQAGLWYPSHSLILLISWSQSMAMTSPRQRQSEGYINHTETSQLSCFFSLW